MKVKVFARQLESANKTVSWYEALISGRTLSHDSLDGLARRIRRGKPSDLVSISGPRSFPSCGGVKLSDRPLREDERARMKLMLFGMEV
jgi:hypothetical protein